MCEERKKKEARIELEKNPARKSNKEVNKQFYKNLCKEISEFWENSEKEDRLDSSLLTIKNTI